MGEITSCYSIIDDREYRIQCLFPTRRSSDLDHPPRLLGSGRLRRAHDPDLRRQPGPGHALDRKTTRLNSSNLGTSYAVFCLKKTKNTKHDPIYYAVICGQNSDHQAAPE